MNYKFGHLFIEKNRESKGPGRWQIRKCFLLILSGYLCGPFNWIGFEKRWFSRFGDWYFTLIHVLHLIPSYLKQILVPRTLSWRKHEVHSRAEFSAFPIWNRRKDGIFSVLSPQWPLYHNLKRWWMLFAWLHLDLSWLGCIVLCYYYYHYVISGCMVFCASEIDCILSMIWRVWSCEVELLPL